MDKYVCDECGSPLRSRYFALRLEEFNLHPRRRAWVGPGWEPPRRGRGVELCPACADALLARLARRGRAQPGAGTR